MSFQISEQSVQEGQQREEEEEEEGNFTEIIEARIKGLGNKIIALSTEKEECLYRNGELSTSLAQHKEKLHELQQVIKQQKEQIEELSTQKKSLLPKFF